MLPWRLLALALPFALAGHAFADPFSFRQLRELVDGKAGMQLEELLPKLPASLRGSFTLMKESQSKQAGSPTHPRALLFDIEAEMIVAFNGHPSQEGFRVLEVAFRRPDGRLELRAITFPEKGSNEAPKVSDANPDRCKRCHGEDPSVFWPQYDVWDGAFGRVDDGLTPYSNEHKELLAWRKSVKGTRYESLVLKDDEYWPYHASSGFQSGADRKLSRMPNLRLSKFLVRLQAERAYRRLKAARPTPFYRALLIYAFSDCEPKWVGWDNQKKLFSLIEARHKKLSPRKERRGSEVIASDGALVPMIWDLLGLDPERDLSLDCRIDARFPAFNYKDGTGRLQTLVNEKLMAEVTGSDAKLADLYKKMRYPTGKGELYDMPAFVERLNRLGQDVSSFRAPNQEEACRELARLVENALAEELRPRPERRPTPGPSRSH